MTDEKTPEQLADEAAIKIGDIENDIVEIKALIESQQVNFARYVKLFGMKNISECLDECSKEVDRIEVSLECDNQVLIRALADCGVDNFEFEVTKELELPFTSDELHGLYDEFKAKWDLGNSFQDNALKVIGLLEKAIKALSSTEG